MIQQPITNAYPLPSGQFVYDPRGQVEAEAQPISPRLPTLSNLRLGVLDNTKWNGGKLLRNVVSRLNTDDRFAQVKFYQKESFSRNATDELIAQIATESDIVITAIGD